MSSVQIRRSRPTVLEDIEELILDRFNIAISATSETFEDDPVRGQGKYVSSAELETKQRIAIRDNLDIELRAGIKEYVEKVIGLPCDSAMIRDMLEEALNIDEDNMFITVAANVDRNGCVASEVQMGRWYQNREDIFLADYSIKIAINGAEIPLSLVNELLFDDEDALAYEDENYTWTNHA